MNLLANIPWSLRWILRYVEWASMSTGILIFALMGDLNKSSSLLLQVITFGVAFVLLSLMLPLERPLWQRRVYVFVEILLAISAGLVMERGLFHGLIPLFLFKTCLLLNRQEVLLTMLATITAYMVGFVWTLPQFIAEINPRDVPMPTSGQITLGTLVSLTGTCTFFVLLGLMFVAERKSRQRAETLAVQVETLAATLERTRIARDIHDSLGHSLTNLNTRLAVAQQKLRQPDVDAVRKAVDTAKFLANQCIDDVNRSLSTMRQSDFDLNQALTTLVEQLRHNQSLQVYWEINLPQLPLQMNHHIYCIVKEGIINIQKHADASEVRFRGLSTPEGILLELEDNGRGFDPNLSYPGLGLKGIEERVLMLAGKLAISSAPNSGTQILVTIPR